MTTQTSTDPEYLVIADLALKWRVSPVTARRTTYQAGFPAPLSFGPRTRRWPAQEVLEWEQQERRPATRVVTSTRPQHRGDNPPVKVRRLVRSA